MNLAEKLPTSFDNDDPPHKQVLYKKTKACSCGSCYKRKNDQQRWFSAPCI